MIIPAHRPSKKSFIEKYQPTLKKLTKEGPSRIC